MQRVEHLCSDCGLSGDENMLSERMDPSMEPLAVLTLEKNHFCEYEQLLSCVLTLKFPKGSKSKSSAIYSTLRNEFTSPVDIKVNNKNKLLLINS